MTASTHRVRWSDTGFLDQLRRIGDPRADRCAEELRALDGGSTFKLLFRQMVTNDPILPTDTPEPLARFLNETERLPSPGGTPLDLTRLGRGQTVFLERSFLSCLVLLLKSVPEGYAAPNLTQILSLTGQLEQHTYRRLLGVLQMVVNVCTPGSFEAGGNALITAQKLRLLHAGIRFITRTKRPDYEARFGVPVCLEDMLGTIMGFSLLVVDGLRTLDTPLTEEQAEDFYQVWVVFGLAMGIHPEGQPDSLEFMPATLAEARTFYDAYKRRHYVSAERNPEGVALTASLLAMMRGLLPEVWLSRIGMRVLPRLYLEALVGERAGTELGVPPLRARWFWRVLMRLFPALWAIFWKEADKLDKSGTMHENLSRIFLLGLVRRSFRGEVTFLIPQRLQDLRELVQGDARDAQPSGS